MSKYYKVNGLKVRISDHEANTKLNGSSDIYFYTKSADNRKLCVASQVECYCEKHDLDISLFQDILNDYPVEEYNPIERPVKVIVSQDFIDGYRAISGKGSMKKKDNYCESFGVNAFKISQGCYEIK
ncbi:hypothetical protein AS589_09510 [Empedobacter brevis]|uniref:hypothetical protein n=1 Tax=Empedobacter brevis TaxID=247 RepID=UPI00132019DB|nr:hypothetical protein [Empedobacter brevis]QHC84992.1 hypothetical protein AS589_09510 [Empedobacter brevis]